MPTDGVVVIGVVEPMVFGVVSSFSFFGRGAGGAVVGTGVGWMVWMGPPIGAGAVIGST